MPFAWSIVLGLAAGTLARLSMLRIDYRQYPTYPHGVLTHLALGFIAALIGSVLVPALVFKEFTAVTFLALAAQEFRQVRNMERETLTKLEDAELVPRGFDYIEGIAKTFEARNYLTMATALAVSGVAFALGWKVALGVAVLLLIASQFLMKGKVVGDLAEVVPARLHFQGSLLMVDDIFMMNVGQPDARDKILAEGLAVLIKPKNDNGRATLHHVGQRQAILHTAAALLGTKREIGELEFTPLARKNIDTGAVGVFILPIEKDFDCLREIINRVPVLESASRKPLSSRAGRIAAD
ncbi:MAG: YIEGIA family protein [Bacillota bacterium]|nr:YIEGIA family protein [Bacillota bacterium]